MTTNQTIDGGPDEQMACMPVDRSYDVRAKMIIAFNETKKAGGDLDDALDAAYKSALRFSPNPISAEQTAPVAAPLDYGSLDAVQRLAVCRGEQVAVEVVLPEREMYCQYLRGVIPNNRLEVEAHKDGWNACLDELKRLNPSL